MFRSSIILRELVHSLAKVTLLLKHSVKLRPFILCGDVAACRDTIFVLFVVQILHKQHTRHFTTCCHFSTQYKRT